MLNTITVNKLREMRLSAMADALQAQMQDSAFQSMSFEDRLGIIVDQEWTNRKNNQLKRLMHRAGFSIPEACMENIQYVPERNLDKEQLLALSTNNYIREHHNVLLLGPTGSGKTYIGCALGVSAVREFFKVRYVRLPEMLTELKIARATNSFPKVIEQYQKPALLIIDEWLLYPLEELEARNFLEITESRYHRASTIFCSNTTSPDGGTNYPVL